MAFPVTPADLTGSESVDALAEAKAGILQCLSELFYVPTGTGTDPNQGTLVYNVSELDDFDAQVSAMKNILCSYACEELSAAKLIESLACLLAVEKGLVSEECCNCCCCSIKK